MVKFLLWCLLLFFCWPLALLALVLYPLVWLLTLPFRLVGIAVDGNSHQPEGQREKPYQRIEHERQKRQRPTEEKKKAPQ